MSDEAIAEPVSLDSFNSWLNGFMQPGSSEKLVLCGPRFMGLATGCYDPQYWPKLRGNAAQRRIKRRYLARMWDVTKDSVAELRARLELGDKPSRLLSTW